ncbi:nucleoside phosphorylase [Lentimicrobium sp.]|jgi:uridine phosphorylase|uniref:nucleoside phosphorylase n=1 Tax=Lentimicrobium sp. TaxID=2034841 RepID=UPI0025FDF74C|nr:nucleoside phosphorylase [Lentimicrobium sp.]MCO5255528.1 nucleoside phosphorylase [Lentimicrobium sp.]MCO5261773.1 nucleoside phosphorylase [Lentimicrobium sp.]HOP13734.1 nucleoside phosphorylase [Lentimicrobium sp.]HPJ63299.1 nucleoside phosphorylase [Lentimicrobium sp.]HPR25553.1 nucleoside phosphorylase [Lentimicrobium sp.]
MAQIGASELIINPDGSIYHLNLKPGELASDIIIVGDPGRVPLISRHFDHIELTRQNREICTHTGSIGGKRISVLSTGMGTDNIDIVLNEIDALFNIDLKRREVRDKHVSLNIIRLGTSGALQQDIPVDTAIVSTHGIGLDGMLYYYLDSQIIIDQPLTRAFISQTRWDQNFPRPYVVGASNKLLNIMGRKFTKGMTATAPGFYGPQGRRLRLATTHPDLNQAIAGFEYNGMKVANFEMETSALYGLGKLLGHNTLTICAIVANRMAKQYSKDYHKTMEQLISTVLESITDLPDPG